MKQVFVWKVAFDDYGAVCVTAVDHESAAANARKTCVAPESAKITSIALLAIEVWVPK